MTSRNLASPTTYRFGVLLLNAFSLLVVALAAVGIAGVVGPSVAQRTNEIGIRIALGAGPLDVLPLIVNSSTAWVMVGRVVGVIGSAGLAPLLAGML